ncbi:hypothetical protein ABMA28_016691 [Loxostege sticticalis]|uniref:Uncharacterized protein n=1 Tax=Loxostege sticticalis TaxID=481309 RepID=A0ABD0T5H9_LOXSC
MERNPGLAKGFLRTQNARERSRRQWEELAVRLNSLGGTIKNYKHAIKKKVAARSAARHWTGGGVEDVVELSELEERIVALCGGEGFSTGDTHLGIQPFPETNSPSSPIPAIQDDGTDNIDVPQQQNLPVGEPSAVIILGSEQFGNNDTHDHPVARRLFNSSSSPAVGTSQGILQDIQLEETVLEDAHVYHPSLSPPRATLSHTPTPQSMPTPSPSRRGSTQVVRERYAASSSRRATFDARTTTNSPSRRSRPHMARSRRGAGSVSSHHTTPVVAHPPSQRRTEFSTITERFLRVEEQQLEIQRSFLERSEERERALIEAVSSVGKGLEALARAIKRD